MDTSEIIVLIGLVINIGLTIWNSFKLKEIEEYKADNDRTNRKISYIHQSIRDLSENDRFFFNLVSNHINESELNHEALVIDHFQRLSTVKGIIDGCVPFLNQKHQKKIKEVYGHYKNLLTNDMQAFDDATVTADKLFIWDQTTSRLFGLKNKATEILQDELNDLLNLEK